MKVGDSKKAAVLAFVAFLAVGFLASRLFIGSATPPAGNAGTPIESAETDMTPAMPAMLTTDPFSNKDLDKSGSSGQGAASSQVGTNPSQNFPVPMLPSIFGPGNGISGNLPVQVEPAKDAGDSRQSGVSADKTRVVLHGIVDAGEPVAFVSVNGTAKKLKKGDRLMGIGTVVWITLEAIELRLKGRSVKVLVGGEVEL